MKKFLQPPVAMVTLNINSGWTVVAPSKCRFVTPPRTHKQKAGRKAMALPILLARWRWRWRGWGILIVDEDEEWGKWVSGAEAATEEIYSHKFAAAPGPRAASFPSSLWGSSLYHLLTCCSVNLSSSPRPKTSELRGSSLCHHLLTLVNFYQQAAPVNFESGPWPKSNISPHDWEKGSSYTGFWLFGSSLCRLL